MQKFALFLICFFILALGHSAPLKAQGSGDINAYPGIGCPGLSTCDPAGHLAEITNLETNYVNAMMRMTEQFSVNALQQMQVIGSFMDADQVLQSKRLHQALQAEAHKDYHPGDQMCRVGTFMRSVAQSDRHSDQKLEDLNQLFMTRFANKTGTAAERGTETELDARIAQFASTYCDVRDNNNGLNAMCANSSGDAPKDKNRTNKDIDVARSLKMPLTLDLEVDENGKPKADLEDIIALGKNLYAFEVFSNPDVLNNNISDFEAPYDKLMDARSLIAVKNVAHNSFLNIAAQKAAVPLPPEQKGGPVYMKFMMREFGMEDGEITEMLGENPSYYAQMEVLTKKIYQNPDFYTNLYDKPANVQRIDVAMQAIDLMQARDSYESLLRREMAVSLLVENRLLGRIDKVESLIGQSFSR